MGGSDLAKAQEQLGEDYLTLVDWAFPENGAAFPFTPVSGLPQNWFLGSWMESGDAERSDCKQG